MPAITSTVRPETISRVLAALPAHYAECHRINSRSPDVAACTIGTVFVDQAGDKCVYAGLRGQNSKYCVIYVRLIDGQLRKGVRGYLAKIALATK